MKLIYGFKSVLKFKNYTIDTQGKKIFRSKINEWQINQDEKTKNRSIKLGLKIGNKRTVKWKKYGHIRKEIDSSKYFAYYYITYSRN